MNILFFLKPKAEVAHLCEDDTLRQALERMRRYGYTAIPVIDRAGQYAGTISEGDLLWNIIDNSAYDSREREHIQVRQIMHGRCYKPASVNATIEDMLTIAMNQNFIPVVDDRSYFIGIVTRQDIMRYYYNNLPGLQRLPAD